MKTQIHLLIALFFSFNTCFGQKATNLVISQVYGGGGNTGATYQNDFIELFNPTPAAINISGWSVQYASASGSSWNVTNLAGTVAPGAYYLIKLASSGSVGNIVSQSDLTGTVNLSASSGKIALCDSVTPLTGNCPNNVFIKDFVGYGSTANCFEGTGPTSGPSNANGISRINEGCTDANDNANDFTTGITPWRYSGSTPNFCSVGILKKNNIPDLFSITPNPATDKINIVCSVFSTAAIIEFYTITGERVFEAKINDLNTEIDISKFPKGFYFYRLNNDSGQIQTGKLVVE